MNTSGSDYRALCGLKYEHNPERKKKKISTVHQQLQNKSSQNRQVSMSLTSSMIPITTAGVQLSQGVFCYGRSTTNHDSQHHTPHCALISNNCFIRVAEVSSSEVFTCLLHRPSRILHGKGGWEESRCMPGKSHCRCTREREKGTETRQQAETA